MDYFSTIDTVIETVTKRRKALMLSQTEVAKRAGISQTHYCQFEFGTKNLSLMRLYAALEVLGLQMVIVEKNENET